MAIVVPGLNAPLTDRDWVDSQQAYNLLPRDDLLDKSCDMMIEKHLPAFFRLIADYDLLDIFGIHSAHIHYQLNDGEVNFGIDGKGPIYREAKPTPINDLRNRNIHGHIFVVVGDCLRAYDFQEGEAPDFSCHNLEAFLRDFISYVIKEGLQFVIGLEAITVENKVRPVTWEVFKDKTSFMLDASEADLHKYAPGRWTGWVGMKQGGGVHVRGNQMHIVEKGEVVCYYDQKSVKPLG